MKPKCDLDPATGTCSRLRLRRYPQGTPKDPQPAASLSQDYVGLWEAWHPGGLGGSLRTHGAATKECLHNMGLALSW